jgi:hypothetical protein
MLTHLLPFKHSKSTLSGYPQIYLSILPLPTKKPPPSIPFHSTHPATNQTRILAISEIATTTLPLTTGPQINMIIAPCTRRQHHAMGMERRRRDRGRACLMQEAGVWLDAREFLAVEVEDFDGVAACSAVCPNLGISWVIREREGWGGGTEKEGEKRKRREGKPTQQKPANAHAYSPSSNPSSS